MAINKRYKSKYDWWLVAILVMSVAIIIWAVFYGFSWVLIICMIPSFAALWLVADCFFNAYYEIDGSILRIKFGALINTKIDIMTIKSILPRKTMLSSPAWSMDRLEIKYGKYGSIVISPSDKIGFLQDCLNLNPSIITKLHENHNEN